MIHNTEPLSDEALDQIGKYINTGMSNGAHTRILYYQLLAAREHIKLLESALEHARSGKPAWVSST